MKFCIRAIIIIVLTSIISGCVSVAPKVDANASKPEQITSESLKFDTTKSNYMKLYSDIFDMIKYGYVDPTNDKEIFESGIDGMINKLDSHSGYMNPEVFTEFRKQFTSSNYSGIGAQIMIDDETGYIKIVAPLDGSPAGKAELKSGDLIISIDYESVENYTFDEAINKIRGPKNTIVKLGIKRGPEIIIKHVMRDDVSKPTVTHKMLNNKIGYMKLTSFTQYSAVKMKKSLKSLISELSADEKLAGLILDLRNNPGGLLSSAIEISDMFVNDGVIVSTRGRSNKIISTDLATSDLLISIDIPMVVLVNGASASSSEIVSGALLDLKRAVIVGVKSYGKGSVQSIIPLRNGGALRLTRAKYYTASGKTIHGVGIMPDIEVILPEDYKQLSLDEIDPQLQKAIDVISNGRADMEALNQ